MTGSLWNSPLGDVQESVAEARPTPAGVATATIAAALGLSLVVKVLRIRGRRQDLIEQALALIAELRSLADEDVAAVEAYMQRREKAAMIAIPERAAEATDRAANLCVEADDGAPGLLAADLEAGRALVRGAAKAIRACVAANAARTP
jgi:formiminotetrahydrofolate cyclodeaminase